jgi:ribosomal 50S subunit-associated protein YjgA (DUF615 family)
MTDAEIKQNLKFIAKYCKDEYNEIRVDELLLNALNLINRQQAEVERLQKENNQFAKMYSEIKAETIKEFAEKVKANKFKHKNFGELFFVEDIDNLVKEMEG